MIRRADERDVPEIARIINAAFEVEREFREGARTSPTEIAKLLEHDVFFVAEEDGRLLGAVHTSIDGATGYFGMLSVDPALGSASRNSCARSLAFARGLLGKTDIAGISQQKIRLAPLPGILEVPLAVVSGSF